jgi:UDP:flavonoid glycosyltransferase YjiC (YdhE family)
MRVLFSCVAAFGHFNPLVPLARALADEGHDVAFATAASFHAQVDAAGFDLLPAGLDQRELTARFAPYGERLLALPPVERRPFSFTWRYGTLDAPAKLSALRDTATAWGPDLVVHDSADLAAPIAAASLGLPTVHHSYGRLVPRACYEHAAAETEPLWLGLGLVPEPLCGAFRGPYLDVCPPSFQTDAVPAGTRVEHLRPVFLPNPGHRAPGWLAHLPARPTIYLTMGTTINSRPLARLLLEALSEVDCNVVATVGDLDPAELRPLARNAVVEPYIPQTFVLPHCSAVVSHGGSGTLLAALAGGLPTLLLPQAADQFENAIHCDQLGAGRVLMPDEVTAEAVREGVTALLEEPSYRVSARGLAAEIASLPGPEQVAPAIATVAAA